MVAFKQRAYLFILKYFPSRVCVFCSRRCRKQYKGIIRERVELAEVVHAVKEQQSAEERMQETARKTLLEKEEGLRVLEEERIGKEEEERLKMMETEKKRKKGNKPMKQREEEQKVQSVHSLADDTKLKQESGNDPESQPNSQHTVSKQQHQGNVKFDEENRLHEQLKILQEQAEKQKENELPNQSISTGTSFTADNRLIDGETLTKKQQQKIAATKESEKQLHEQKQLDKDDNKQKLSIQEEHKVHESETCETARVHRNNRKPDRQQKKVQDMKRKEAVKIDGSGKKNEEEKVKQEQRDNDILPQDNIMSIEKKNLTQSNDPLVEICDSTVQLSPKAIAARTGQDLSLQLSTDARVACQTDKPNTAKYQAKQSTCKESSNVWQKTVEAKRLNWMHQCESWRYI